MIDPQLFLSVVIPAYQAEATIGGAVESVVSALSTTANSEIIVVNDGSADDTQWILRKLQKRFDCLRIFNIQNRGVSFARNYGASKALGKYVSFLDADDVYVKEFGFGFIPFIKNNPDADFLTASYRINGLDVYKKPSTVSDFQYFLQRQYFCTNSIVVKRDILLRHQFRENFAFGEDVDLWLRLLKLYKSAHYNCVVSEYRFQPKIHDSRIHPFPFLSAKELSFTDSEASAVKKRFESRNLMISCVKREITAFKLIKLKSPIFLFYYVFGENGYKIVWNIRHFLRRLGL